MKQGDIFRFTEGDLARLTNYVTEVTKDSENKTRIWYNTVGDGRSETLKVDTVYEFYTFETDHIMQSAYLLAKAKEHENYAVHSNTAP